MSIRERARKLREEKEKEEQQVVEEVIKDQSQSKPQEVEPFPQPQVTQKTPVKEVDPYEQFLLQVPSWTKKPWMYIQPKHEGQLTSWVDAWSNLILDYCRLLVKHVLSIPELQTVEPFHNSTASKKLSQDQLITIFNSMESKGLSKWLDDNKIRVHIYYRTLEEWAEQMFDHLMNTGKAAEILTFFELEQMGQEWSSLPRESLIEVIEILISKNKAKYATKNKDAIQIEF